MSDNTVHIFSCRYGYAPCRCSDLVPAWERRMLDEMEMGGNNEPAAIWWAVPCPTTGALVCTVIKSDGPLPDEMRGRAVFFRACPSCRQPHDWTDVELVPTAEPIVLPETGVAWINDIAEVKQQ